MLMQLLSPQVKSQEKKKKRILLILSTCCRPTLPWPPDNNHLFALFIRIPNDLLGIIGEALGSLPYSDKDGKNYYGGSDVSEQDIL